MIGPRALSQEIDTAFLEATDKEKDKILELMRMHMITYPAKATHLQDLINQAPRSIITPGQSASAAFGFMTGGLSMGSKPGELLPKEGKEKEPDTGGSREPDKDPDDGDEPDRGRPSGGNPGGGGPGGPGGPGGTGGPGGPGGLGGPYPGPQWPTNPNTQSQGGKVKIKDPDVFDGN